MKTKKIFALLCLAVMLVSFMTPAMAAEPERKVIDLGDGFYVVETITYGPASRSGNTVKGKKSGTVYQGSTVIGQATLHGEFDISGSSAKATKATIEGSGRNGWEYTGGTTSLSGNTATGTATFRMGSSTKNLVLTLSCSPSGALS